MTLYLILIPIGFHISMWILWNIRGSGTDVGRLPGIDEQVDLNVFNGSMEELKSMTIPDTLKTDTL